MKKKIAIISTTSKTLEAFFINHINSLTKNYEVTLISNFDNINFLSKINNFNKNNFKHLNMTRGYDFFGDLINLIKIIFFLRKNNFYLTLSCTPKAGFIVSIASYICNVKVRTHIFTGQVWTTKFGLEKFFLKKIDSIISLLSTNLLTDSFSQKDFLINNKILNKDKVQVLANGSISGVNLNKFNKNELTKISIKKKLNIDDNALIILFLGRLNKDKGILDLIKAFNNIKSSNKFLNIFLLIVGPDEMGISKKIYPNIYYKPYTNKPEEYMSASDIFCLPSYREGFGMSAVEAGACQVPIVASRIYGLTDAVEENVTGLMHEPGNINQIEDCLLKLINNPDLRKSMGEKARKRSIKFFDQKKVTLEMYKYISNKVYQTSKKNIVIVASTIMSVQVFLIPQINILLNKYNVTIIANLRDFKSFNNKLLLNCKLIHLDINRGISVLSDILCLIKLFIILLYNRYSLIFSVTPKGGFLSILASFFAFIPIRIHWFGGQVWFNKNGFLKFLLMTTDRCISFFSTNLLTECQSQLDFLVSKKIVKSKKISILGRGSICGVDHSKFFFNSIARINFRKKISINEHDIIILYLGRLNFEKGILDLLNAFKKIYNHNTKINLLLVGPDEDNINLLLKKSYSSLLGNIKIFPYTNKPEEYMSASDIFCLPSYREGFGMSAVEAGACQVPIVASRIYGLTDAVEENVTGLMHEPGNINQIEDCLLKLINNPDLRKSMGEKARKRSIKFFDQKTVVNNFTTYIDSNLV